ncbi:tetratricopeptide repeat protein [Luedemannella helvata]|uniref:Tetratricopeptide repeat protein n=1 Tax=Luedemannella helvata TaxID=349315 RepID=A0ABP4WHJ1_9ACTN
MGDDLDSRLSQVSTSEDIDELIDLGCDLADARRLSDAERCFRRAASLGSAVAEFNLGNTLADSGRPAEAVAAYERALAGGEAAAWFNLGTALEDLGDLAGAMRAFRAAFRAGDAKGALALAFSLREQGERAAAQVAAREAVEAGDPTAAAVLACWEWDETGDPALEPALRAGADLYPSARVDLAQLLVQTGRVGEARAALERGAKLGEAESWLPLGNLYADEFDDAAAAETAYRSGIAAGDTYCHHNLGVLLLERGADEQAREQFQLGADAGDALAARALRDLH